MKKIILLTACAFGLFLNGTLVAKTVTINKNNTVNVISKKGPLVLASSVVPTMGKGGNRGVKVTPNATSLSYYGILVYTVHRVSDNSVVATQTTTNSPASISGLVANTDYYVVLSNVAGTASSPHYYFTSL